MRRGWRTMRRGQVTFRTVLVISIEVVLNLHCCIEPSYINGQPDPQNISNKKSQYEALESTSSSIHQLLDQLHNG